MKTTAKVTTAVVASGVMAIGQADAAEPYAPSTWLIKPFPGRSLLNAVRRAIGPIQMASDSGR